MTTAARSLRCWRDQPLDVANDKKGTRTKSAAVLCSYCEGLSIYDMYYALVSAVAPRWSETYVVSSTGDRARDGGGNRWLRRESLSVLHVFQAGSNHSGRLEGVAQ